MPATSSSARPAGRPGSRDPGTHTGGRVRNAPVERGLGMRPAPDAGPDRVRVRAPLTDAVLLPGGAVAPVLPATLADSGIGFLVVSRGRLAAGAPTVDLRLDLAGTPAADSEWLTADLALLHLDDRIGLGRAEMRDDAGTLVAHAMVTMTLTGVPDRPGGLAAAGRAADSATPAASGPASDGHPDDDFRAELPPFDPTALRPEALRIDPETGDALYTPGVGATNLNGTTHGAVLSGFAQAAQVAYLDRHGAAGTRPLSLTVDFLRPVQVDDELRARTEVVRDGRRFWTLRTELLLPDGRAAVRAVGAGLRTPA
ncbi:acyl-CoA thioesterase domain-containing protein [Pseudonocardia phyllosphaerae]|uniref:acyl-CoA thioesterase domain-containing protein n=1 Tax=Pseudonocardia phyllosphaerae TaxID=3390502 RepID=UPI00397BE750